MDDDQFASLFHLYNAFICRVIYHIVRNQQDMEDVAASAWQRAWEALPTLQDRSSFKSWLTTIAKHEAIDHVRKKNRKQEDRNEEDEGPVDPINIEEEVAIAIAFEEAMEAALERMRPEQRKCFHYHLQGWTIKAIAKRLGLTKGTVGTYISNAYRILHEELRKRL